MNPTQFLERPTPFLDESASSWRQRTAIANGHYLYPLFNEPRRTDPDAPKEEVVRLLADMSGLDPTRVRGLSLNALLPMPGASETRSLRRWLIPLRYTHGVRWAGPAFCPVCLDEQADRAYFRLTWRLAVITECPRHNVRLNDHCGVCGSAVWPHTAVVAKLYVDRGFALNQCAYCGNDLRTSDAVAADASRAKEITAALHLERVSLGGSVVKREEYFDAMWIIAQLFMRRQTAIEIVKKGPRWLPGCNAAALARVNAVEAASISLRRPILECAADILSNWPATFIDFTTQCGIKHFHFVDSVCTPPTWMRSVIDDELRIQRRGVTATTVRAAIQQLREQGQTPTRTQVCRALQCSTVTAIAQTFAKRRHASEAELIVFEARLSELSHTKHKRRSSRIITLRNCILIAASVVLQRPVRALCRWTLAELLDASRAFQPGHTTVQLLKRNLLAWSSDLVQLQAELWGTARSHKLQAAREGRGFARSVETHLRLLMQGMDELLPKSSEMFWCFALPLGEESA
jgi:hypothetical protein